MTETMPPLQYQFTARASDDLPPITFLDFYDPSRYLQTLYVCEVSDDVRAVVGVTDAQDPNPMFEVMVQLRAPWRAEGEEWIYLHRPAWYRDVFRLGDWGDRDSAQAVVEDIFLAGGIDPAAVLQDCCPVGDTKYGDGPFGAHRDSTFCKLDVGTAAILYTAAAGYELYSDPNARAAIKAAVDGGYIGDASDLAASVGAAVA